MANRQLTIRILRRWETPLAYCFDIAMAEVGGEIYIDDFRWIKNVLPDGTEKNRFTEEEIANTAARHFLRLAGRIKRGDNYPKFYFEKNGKDQYEITGDWSDKQVVPKAPLTTVATLSAAYDAYVDNAGTKDATSTTLPVRNSGFFIRIGLRFTISSLTNPTVTNTQLIVNVTTANADRVVDIQAYNQDGLADPEADSGANMYTRCGNDASPYVVGNTTMFDTTGVKTIDLGASADADVEAARDAGSIFSIGMEATDANGSSATIEATENAGTDEPKLEVTYTAGPYQVSLSGGMTPAGTITTLTKKKLAGAITPAGALTKLIQKALSGGLTPAGTIASIVRTFFIVALSGGMTPVGALTKTIKKSLAGGITPAGALTKLIKKGLTGAITPAGALTKLIKKIFTGGVTPAGLLIVELIKTIWDTVVSIWGKYGKGKKVQLNEYKVQRDFILSGEGMGRLTIPVTNVHVKKDILDIHNFVHIHSLAGIEDWAGYIESQTWNLPKENIELALRGAAGLLTMRLTDKVATYSQMPSGVIISDLLRKANIYHETGIVEGTIDKGGPLVSKEFKYTTLKQVLDDLMQATGFQYWFTVSEDTVNDKLVISLNWASKGGR